ncbi:MAG: acyl dehydratase [Rhodospirillaceae bacterium]|jgi:acyl dehydratase|nr:acyl dehydratase [Rhodospirillaceae bacterium]|tara:strand:+ start:657 stop:1106 length:450 start_codon:yes stop_codon:yes gene_type:complete
MHTRFFEGFKVGDIYETRAVTLTEGQMVDFSMQYDPQPIHTDQEASKHGIHGSIISSGLQTLGLANRLWIELGLMGENNLGGPGLDNVRWPRPVFAGDTLRTVVEVVAARESKSKLDRGIVTFGFTTYNQKNEVVMTYECMDMIRRAPK